MSKNNTVYIFCDGACSPNPGKGGWGAILRYGDTEKELSGNHPNTTNNRMELTAAIKALEALTRPCTVIITTDSKYLADCFRNNWMKNWLKRNWKTASGNPVKNKDLWLQLNKAMQPHTITWKWTEGHSGHPENERADTLAVNQRKKI